MEITTLMHNDSVYLFDNLNISKITGATFTSLYSLRAAPSEKNSRLMRLRFCFEETRLIQMAFSLILSRTVMFLSARFKLSIVSKFLKYIEKYLTPRDLKLLEEYNKKETKQPQDKDELFNNLDIFKIRLVVPYLVLLYISLLLPLCIQ